MTSLQLPLDGKGLDPQQLAGIPIVERIELYAQLGLDQWQREAAEAAVRLVLSRRYGASR